MLQQLFSRRRVGLLIAGATAAGGLYGGLATGAHAATTVACQINGSTTSLTPIPAPPATGGSGTYTFSGPATCVVNGALQSGTVTVSDGAYQNTVCGTGTATGTADFAGGITVNPLGFKIQFVAGVGVIQATSGGTGGGVVDITPSNTGGCATTAVTGFNVHGTFSGTQ